MEDFGISTQRLGEVFSAIPPLWVYYQAIRLLYVSSSPVLRTLPAYTRFF